MWRLTSENGQHMTKGPKMGRADVSGGHLVDKLDFRALWELAVSGDETAERKILDQIQGQLGMRLLASKNAADLPDQDKRDILAQAASKVHPILHRGGSSVDSPAAYVSRVVLNLLIDYYRKRSRQLDTAGPEAQDPTTGEACNPAMDNAAAPLEGRPEPRMQQAEAIQVVHDAIDQMSRSTRPTEKRQAVVLRRHYLEEEDLESISRTNEYRRLCESSGCSDKTYASSCRQDRVRGEARLGLILVQRGYADEDALRKKRADVTSPLPAASPLSDGEGIQNNRGKGKKV